MRELEPQFHGELITAFSEELETFIFERNHMFKFKGLPAVIEMLNFICDFLNAEYKTTLSFALSKDNILRVESDDMNYEITLLPLIFKQFRYCYRCGSNCYNMEKELT